MARKTAMKKDPTVSIAIPQSEKDRLRTLKPGGPSVSDGVVQGKPGPLRRLSPGVYRSSSGQLVGSKGQALPGQPSMRDRASNAANQAAGRTGMGDGRDRAQQGVLLDAMNRAPQPGQIATRPPAPLGTMPGNAATEAGNLAQGSQPIVRQPGFMSQITPEQWQQLQQFFQPASRPQNFDSISQLLQQGGQQQQPIMLNPQMNMSMPQQSFEQWKPMQISQQMPQQYQPMMPYRR
jgi:hypothetical protein